MSDDYKRLINEKDLSEHAGQKKKGGEGARLRLAAATDDPRPVIRLGVKLEELMPRIAAALATDTYTFERDGDLVHVVRQDPPRAARHAHMVPDTPTIYKMHRAVLRIRLCAVAHWESFNPLVHEYVRVVPTDRVVDGLINLHEYPGVRSVAGILEAPAMLPSGCITSNPYDEHTHMIYMPNCEYDPIPENPTSADAHESLQALLEPFCDFPYAKETHRYVPVAALLTLLARPAILGACPGFLFDASTRGSGKSLQADVVSLIATGRSTAKMNYPTDPIELEKVLGGYALIGASIINFDNVGSCFGGAALDRCLTAEDKVSLRVLGRSEIQSKTWRAVIMATGNNLMLAGDTARRVLISRLESAEEHPEDRTDFRHADLRTWVKQNRTRLVRAALTLLRAYHLAGRPGMRLRAWGSFEPWSALIPPAIMWAGGPNVLDARPAADGQEEPEKLALAILLRELPRLDEKGNGMTAKGIVSALYTHDRLKGQAAPDGFDDLREAIEMLVTVRPGCAPDTKALGKALARGHGRVIQRCKLEKTIGHGAVMKWRVAEV